MESFLSGGTTKVKKASIQPQNIKGIIFDVDGTLYYQSPVRFITLLRLFLHNLFRPFYLVRVLKVIRCYRGMLEKLRNTNVSNGSLPELQLQMTALFTNESLAFVQEVIKQWMFEQPSRFLRFFQRTGLLEFIDAAQAQGLILGVYSDYPSMDKLEQMNISRYFSAVVSSFDAEVLRFKPESKGFLVCSQKLGLKPEEILFIGDREEVDGIGAALSGMQVILVGGLLKTNHCIRYRSFKIIRKELFG